MDKSDLKYFLIEWIEAAERLDECARVIGKERMKVIAEELKTDPQTIEVISRLSKLEDSMDAFNS